MRPAVVNDLASVAVESFVQTLEKYGADTAAIRSFDTDAPDLLPYATLLAARKNNDPVLAALTGVYEWQNTPLVFLVDAEKLAREQGLDGIRRRLAMRGDAPYLGVVRPGQLTLYRVSLDSDPADRALIDLHIPAGEEQATLPHLGNHRPEVALNPRQWISKVVLTLLSASIGNLKTQFKVADNDAISLVGRALFTRFLADRGLLPNSLFPRGQNEAAALFDSADQAAKTSRWLDDTFNGDFLPLSAGLFESLPPEGFKTLGNILRRAAGGQLSLGWEEKWENLDFAYIPVGVLSQAYEHYLREHAPDKQRKEGGYYTPRIIADMLVRGAFHALRRDGVAHKARVLDAAAGAGVFLITAFRELVSERWRHEHVRPDTKTLRNILYEQITGFDINESALRFAALGLYLASIELDPNPEPVEKLRFKNLRGSVLHNVGDDNGKLPSRSLGSLGSRVGDVHSGRYDLVVGNPPWASGTGLPDWSQVEERVSQIARTRVLQGSTPKLPNEVLDLPFVWRAMEWARPGGQIAFALHARLLFQQGEGMSEARSALFGALNVTGIVNGSEVRNTKVWPDISAPFCLLFARNELPPPGAGFRFVSPRIEGPLNAAGGWRVDVSNAETITSDQVIDRPAILKTMFRGSPLDLEAYDRLMSRKLRTLDEFWRAHFGEFRGRPRFAGNGYQKLRKSSRIRKRGDGQPGVSASYLCECDLPELTPDAMQTPLVNVSGLPKFSLARLHDPRPLELFRGPLLLVQKSPPVWGERIRVLVADDDLVFNETYYGYSAKTHPDGKLLVRYLAMLVGSKFALWHALITSGEFGFEREVVEKFIIDSIPIPSFEDLKPSDRKQINHLFEAVAKENNETQWARVDDWVVSLYGLRRRDLQGIADTLRFNLPFADNRNAAQTPPSPPEIDVFCTALRSELKPWAERAGNEIHVLPVRLPSVSPWAVVRVGSVLPSAKAPMNPDWPELMRAADQLAATEIIHPDSASGCLWLARLNQARYWSRSQARLAARRITWEHVDFLVGLSNR
ncbi:MAG: N-6 DNA methylase [Bryobacteraceae bacterium]